MFLFRTAEEAEQVYKNWKRVHLPLPFQGRLSAALGKDYEDTLAQNHLEDVRLEGNQLIPDHKGIPLRRSKFYSAYPIIKQMAQGIHSLHQRKIANGKLDLDTVCITQNATKTKEFVILTDFSHLVSNEAEYRRGYPAYYSPERLKYVRQVPRPKLLPFNPLPFTVDMMLEDDMWAVGCILYFLVTGKAFYDFQSIQTYLASGQQYVLDALETKGKTKIEKISDTTVKYILNQLLATDFSKRWTSKQLVQWFST